LKIATLQVESPSAALKDSKIHFNCKENEYKKEINSLLDTCESGTNKNEVSD